MKVKTSELKDRALDWAVVTIECALPAPFKSNPTVLNGTVRIFRPDIGAHSEPVSPSTDWSQGGPIIEREGITTTAAWDTRYTRPTVGPNGIRWTACVSNCGQHMQYGPTPLIAAMRCYVSIKLGDEVDVPDVLVSPL